MPIKSCELSSGIFLESNLKIYKCISDWDKEKEVTLSLQFRGHCMRSVTELEPVHINAR